jgi:hypothetical protein
LLRLASSVAIGSSLHPPLASAALPILVPAVAVTIRPSSRLLRQAYVEWVEEQIEEFKETVSRADLLRLADEVVEELRVNQEGQYQLTELLLWAAVDRKIFRMLELPGYRAWCATHSSRASESFQQEPLLPFCVE